MTPNILAHKLEDVKINQIHRKIDMYREKMSDFKSNTKLKDMINTSFAVPDYCIELTMEVEGWEDKTIEEVELAIENILIVPPSTYSQKVCLGWKSMDTGSIRLTFILMESITENLLKLCEEKGVISIHLEEQFCMRRTVLQQRSSLTKYCCVLA